MTRATLRRIMANAIRERGEMDERDAAEQAARATDTRRALWSSYSDALRASLMRGALRDAREKP